MSATLKAQHAPQIPWAFIGLIKAFRQIYINQGYIFNYNITDFVVNLFESEGFDLTEVETFTGLLELMFHSKDIIRDLVLDVPLLL